MAAVEYLASYGLSGDFGRFRADAPLVCRRGERIVVRGPRGVEIAEVLLRATPGHAPFLPNTSVGAILRRVNAEDERAEILMRDKGRQLFQRGRELAGELEIPLELLDVEVTLDGRQALLHLLRGSDADVRPFVSTLAREFDLHIALVDLARPTQTEGCGRPDCGQGEGGCSTCGAGGGCGSCGSAEPREVQAHFAQLREQMESRRTALL